MARVRKNIGNSWGYGSDERKMGVRGENGKRMEITGRGEGRKGHGR